MISVRSLPQLLNGNSRFSFLFLSIFILISCSTGRTILKDDRPEGEKPTVEDLAKNRGDLKMDTIEWTVISEEDSPPITSEMFAGPGIFKKESYNISVFLPFNARQTLFDSLTLTSNAPTYRFVNFYAGALMALKDLEKEGKRLNLRIFDTERNKQLFEGQLNSFENRNADLIIGPYDREAMRIAADWAKEQEIPVISPWQVSSRLASENPYYIKFRPSIEDHFRAILAHAKENFENDQIVLLNRDNRTDKAVNNLLQRLSIEIDMDDDIEPLREFTVWEDSLMLADSVFFSVFDPMNSTVFILPNYTSRDEDYIYSCLRKISAEKADNQVYIYGMPIIYDLEKVSFDIYRSMSIRICRSKFVDRADSEVKRFEKLYFKNYGALPSKDAFEGHDVMFFAGQMISKYGTAFQYYLRNERTSHLQTSYNIQASFVRENGSDDRFTEINYFENKHLDIIEYKDDKFVILER